MSSVLLSLLLISCGIPNVTTIASSQTSCISVTLKLIQDFVSLRLFASCMLTPVSLPVHIPAITCQSGYRDPRTHRHLPRQRRSRSVRRQRHRLHRRISEGEGRETGEAHRRAQRRGRGRRGRARRRVRGDGGAGPEHVRGEGGEHLAWVGLQPGDDEAADEGYEWWVADACCACESLVRETASVTTRYVCKKLIYYRRLLKTLFQTNLLTIWTSVRWSGWRRTSRPTTTSSSSPRTRRTSWTPSARTSWTSRRRRS